MTSDSEMQIGDNIALEDAQAREAATREILQVISQSRTDEQPVFEAILRNASRLLDSPAGGGLHLLNEACTHSQLLGSWGDDSGTFPIGTEFELAGPLPQSIAMREARIVHTPDIKQSPTYLSGDVDMVKKADIDGVGTFLCVPLVADGVAIGCFNLNRYDVKPYSEAEIALAETFAAQAVIAIENVRQFRELQTRLEREAATREILQVISQSRDDEGPVFDAILKRAALLCRAPQAGLMMLNEPGTHVKYIASWGPPSKHFQPGISEWPIDDPIAVTTSIRESRIVNIPDIVEDELTRQGHPTRLEIIEEEGIRSILAVPLISDGKAIGCLDIYRLEVKPFTEDEVTLVQSFAAQAVIAIENVRQFRELQTRLEREAATREILYVISQSRADEQPVFEAILRNAARLLNSPAGGGLHLLNEARTHSRMLGSWGEDSGTLPIGTEFELAGPLPQSVAMRETRIVHTPDIKQSLIYLSGNVDMVKKADIDGVGTFLSVPLVADGVAIGCFNLNRYDVNPYTEAEIALVETFAQQAVIAIENVRQFRELQTRLEREAATREILEVISQSRADEKPVFDAILENVSRLCNSPLTYLTMANEERTHVIVPAHRGARPKFAAGLDNFFVEIEGSALLATRVITEGNVIRVDDLADTELYRDREPYRVSMVENEGIRSILVVPLSSGGQTIGSIILYRREVAPFSDDDVAVAESFAAQAVIAVENVKQFKALQARTDEVQALNENLESQVATQVDELERMGRLKRFLSPQVADAVLSSGDDKLLASHRALIATLFCDMRGFTAFCETAEPEEAIEVLQVYHQEMGALIVEYGAGVDHRSGDGIMVIFNDPLPCDSPAEDAVKLALAMRDRMAGLCTDWRKLGHRLGFGVGISLGYATVGVVGSAGRYDYTASGTAVNLAARLCDQASDGEILLSPRAQKAVEDTVVVEPAGELTLKGIQAPVAVARVIRLKNAEAAADLA